MLTFHCKVGGNFMVKTGIAVDKVVNTLQDFSVSVQN